jgi:glycosyltransferase involved in cell wall biosynthesis
VDWVLILGKHLIVVEDSQLIMDGRPLLSLIVPAYNEGKRLPQTLPKIIEFVETQSFNFEIIIVDNNSSDDTRQIAEQFAEKHAFIRVLDEKRQGKGAAVRAGMLEAYGEFLFMADADLSMPIGEVSKFLPPQLDEYDVAIASREIEGAVRYDEPAYRHLMGRIAQRRGYDIVEVPIAWYYRANSRISPISDAFNMFREVLKIRVNGWRGYYDKPESADAGVEPN